MKIIEFQAKFSSPNWVVFESPVADFRSGALVEGFAVEICVTGASVGASVCGRRGGSGADVTAFPVVVSETRVVD